MFSITNNVKRKKTDEEKQNVKKIYTRHTHPFALEKVIKKLRKLYFSQILRFVKTD